MDGLAVRTSTVLANEKITANVLRMAVRGCFPGRPAQFYMLRAWDLDPLLARPMSVFEQTEEKIAFLYEVRGRGTEFLSRLKPGDELSLFGPLGNGWERSDGRIALVGGGCGIAPLLHTAKVFGDVDLYLGFRERPFLVEAFEQVSRQIMITSESKEKGRTGLITDVFDPSGYDACYACGPYAMLKTLARRCRAAFVPLFVSLEERMACGIGACLGCAVLTTTGIRRVCRDGPVFCAEEVIWDA